MKKVITALTVALLSTLTLSAQETIKKGTIATFKVDNNNEMILQSKDDGVSINIAGYAISLGGAKKSSDEEYTARSFTVGTGGTTVTKVAYEEDGKSIKKKKKSKISIASNAKLGFITLSSPDYSIYEASDKGFMDLRTGKSIYFGLDLVGVSLSLNDSGSVQLKTGINLMYYNYTFADDITIGYQDQMIYPVALDGDYKKSKLTTTYFAIPLSLQIKLGGDISIEPGVYAGVLYGSHTKYKEPKSKSKGIRGINDAVAGASLTLDFDGIGLYCDYNFTSLFEDCRGPETQAMTMGVKFSF